MSNRILTICIALACCFSAFAQTKKFIGAWKLVSTIQTFADGASLADPQVGPRALGYMIYSKQGRMCAMFLNPDRPKWKSPEQPTEEELRVSMRQMGAYCGTWEVHTKEKYILHHVELDRIPNGMGSTRKRFYTFQGNRLILRIDPTTLAPPVVGTTVTWERVP